MAQFRFAAALVSLLVVAGAAVPLPAASDVPERRPDAYREQDRSPLEAGRPLDVGQPQPEAASEEPPVATPATELGRQGSTAAGPSAAGRRGGSHRWGNVRFITPDTIADIAETAAPSVVNIVCTRSGTRDEIARWRADSRARDSDATKRLRRYFGLEVPSEESGGTFSLCGSGVIVRQDGLILTSLHVVESPRRIEVTLLDGRTYEARVLARDSFSDLAVIKIDANNLPVVRFGDAGELRRGDWVIAIGNQMGLKHTVTHGLVSGIGREAKGYRSFGAKTGAVRFIQTDCPINPGSSGGPLLNLRGEVVGINTFIRDDAQNVGFAVPSNIAQEVAEKLSRQGHIPRPYIGIEMSEAPARFADGAGVEVTRVKSGGPARAAGLQAGDIITYIGDTAVTNADEVSSLVAKSRVGDTLRLRINRDGSERLLTVRVQALPDAD